MNEPLIRVVLHQAVDFPLSCQEHVDVGLVEVLHDSVLGVEIQVYLQPDRSSECQRQTADFPEPNRRRSVTSLGASLLINSS